MTLLEAVFISTFVWQAEIFFALLDRKLHLACKCRIIHYVWFNDIVTAGRSPVLHCAVGLGLGFATGDFVCKLCCPRVVLLCQWFASSLYDWKNVAQRKMLRKEKCSPKIEQKCDNGKRVSGPGPESWDSTTQNSRRQFVNCIQPS